MTTEQQPFLNALRKHNVEAKVMHLDHYRVKGGVAVRTDFIILAQSTLKPADAGYFDSFLISKTFSAFRELACSLQTAAASFSSSPKTPAASKLIQYCDLIAHLMESKKISRLGKVNYLHVKQLAHQRSQILDSVLHSTCQSFPNTEEDDHVLVTHIARILELFFLTDHCSVEDTAFYNHKQEKKTAAVATGNHNPLEPILNPLAGIIGILDPRNNKKKDEDKATTAVPKQASTVNATDRGGPRASMVVPLTRKDRRSQVTRAHDAQELERALSMAGLVLDDDDEVEEKAQVKTKKSSLWTANNPWLWFAFMGTFLVILARASSVRIQLDADWGLLLLFAAYCLGLHTPSRTRATPTTTTVVPVIVDRSGRRLLQRTLITQTSKKTISSGKKVRSVTKSTQVVQTASTTKDKPEFVETKTTTDEESLESSSFEEEEGFPMSEFPTGAELGSVLNCWGRSACVDFKIRGPNYLKDKKKIPSQDFLFPIRGVDLFLTDTCPDHVGRNPALLNGKMRDEPTFLVNFRLPWGVLVLYFSIPPKFVPFLQAGYETVSSDQKKKLESSLNGMTAGERCVCRFLMNDKSHKNKTFKIVPVVVKGPWVVRQVVGGKPALIGNKLPINYLYQKDQGPGKAMYWEADLDIAASSAARSILSVARTYTQQLTVDLGFVVQGNTSDELPEQMLVGCRLHGVDPLTAPSYPPMRTAEELSEHMAGMTDTTAASSSDDGSVTPTTAAP